MCPECEQKLDYLDIITDKSTREMYALYICHNEGCAEYGSIWNDKYGDLRRGDPSGLY